MTHWQTRHCRVCCNGTETLTATRVVACCLPMPPRVSASCCCGMHLQQQTHHAARPNIHMIIAKQNPTRAWNRWNRWNTTDNQPPANQPLSGPGLGETARSACSVLVLVRLSPFQVALTTTDSSGHPVVSQNLKSGFQRNSDSCFFYLFFRQHVNEMPRSCK